MEFYRAAKPARQVPIIPLIDILAILLIFLIVSSTFKKKRPVMKINLPTVENLPTATVTEARTTIAVSPEGETSLDGAPVPEGFLVEYLEVFIEKSPESRFELEADQGITLDQLLHVWDALTKVGVSVADVPTRINVAGGESAEPTGEDTE